MDKSGLFNKISQHNITQSDSVTSNTPSSSDNTLQEEPAKIKNQQQSEDTTTGVKRDTQTSISDTTKKNIKYPDKEVQQILLRAREKEKEMQQKDTGWKYVKRTPIIPDYKIDTIPYIGDTLAEPPSFYENMTSGLYASGPVTQKKKKTDVKEILISKETQKTQTKTVTEKPIVTEPIEKKETTYGSDWILGVLIISLVIFITTRLFYNKYIKNIRKSTYNFNIAERTFRETNIIAKRAWFFLNLVFILNMGLFAYELCIFSDVNLRDIWHPVYWMLLFSLCIFIIYFTKYIACHITGFLFNRQKLFSEYLFNIFLYNKNTGIFLFPVIIAIPYVPEHIKRVLIIIGLVIIVWFLFWRLIRSLQLVINKKVSFFYLILYLCILEILPLLVLYRYFNDYI
ncbi:MAG: DUF4271 domain-containing protein [Bacteroidota bacterium]